MLTDSRYTRTHTSLHIKRVAVTVKGLVELRHGARGRVVGLYMDLLSQVETGGGSFDHRVPEDQRAFTFVAVPAWA